MEGRDMFSKFFDPDAPWTVRAGVICLVVLSVFDCAYSLLTIWAEGGLSLGLWRAVIRPAVGLGASLAWAWGIARMLGAAYWCWVVMMALVAVVVVVASILSVLGFGSPFALHRWTMTDGIGLALVLVACALLLSGPSLRAFWRHGRLSPRKSPEIA